MIKCFSEEDICADARVTAISVCERMDPDKFVVEAGSSFQWRIDVVLHPVLSVFQELADLNADQSRIDLNVLLPKLVGARPTPDIAEKAPVQLPQELVCQDCSLAPAGEPEQPSFDIGLFEFVQLSARGDMLLSHTFQFIRVQRRSAYGFNPDLVHG